jgi:hypothetical protein
MFTAGTSGGGGTRITRRNFPVATGFRDVSADAVLGAVVLGQELARLRAEL